MQNIKNYLMNLNIVYISDDQDNKHKVEELLKRFFYSVNIYNNSKDFLESHKTTKFGLIFTDDNLFDNSGINLIKNIRNNDKKIPIILLSKSLNEKKLFECLQLNVQSYIVKPLTFTNLTDALGKVIDHLEITNNLAFQIDDFSFYLNTSILVKNNEEIILNKKETKLLHLLIANKNIIVSYKEMESKIWIDNDEIMTLNALRTVVKTLRKKLDNTFLIRNISGKGYILDCK